MTCSTIISFKQNIKKKLILFIKIEKWGIKVLHRYIREEWVIWCEITISECVLSKHAL